MTHNWIFTEITFSRWSSNFKLVFVNCKFKIWMEIMRIDDDKPALVKLPVWTPEANDDC